MIPIRIRIPGAVIIIAWIAIDIRIVRIEIIIQIRPALTIANFHPQVAFFFVIIIIVAVSVLSTPIITVFILILYTHIFCLRTFRRKINIVWSLTGFISCRATRKNE
jgi:hypothetical protein